MLNVHIKKRLAHYELEVDFTAENEIIVLFGPSGSGKTTILNCIAGLTHPDIGKIVLNEQVFDDSGQRSLPARKRNVGYLFQDYALFPHMTVEKNILYGAKRNGEGMTPILDKLLDVLAIRHLMVKYPHQISGGEKQMVALARSLATEPSVLLLDEPLSALDSETRIDCQDELLRLHEMWKIPFIIVTHDLGEAEKLGDRILFIHNGKLRTTASGPTI